MLLMVAIQGTAVFKQGAGKSIQGRRREREPGKIENILSNTA